eukprot:gene1837-2508_t
MFRFPWSTSSPQRQNPNWIHLARDPQGLTDPHMTRTIQTRKESAYRVFARFTASRWSPQRDTLVESAHDSLGAMRTSKLANMLLLPWPNLEIVRYECLLPGNGEAAKDWIRYLHKTHNLTKVHRFSPADILVSMILVAHPATVDL